MPATSDFLDHEVFCAATGKPGICAGAGGRIGGALTPRGIANTRRSLMGMPELPKPTLTVPTRKSLQHVEDIDKFLDGEVFADAPHSCHCGGTCAGCKKKSQFCDTGANAGKPGPCPKGQTLDRTPAQAGARVKVGKGVGSILEGKSATITEGPIKHQGVTGIYKVRGDEGHEEHIHGSRLAHHSESFAEGGTIKGAEIFRAGIHRGKEYTPENLDEMIENFRQNSAGDKPSMRVPAVLGHEENQEYLDRTDIPAAAWVSNIYRDGPILKADFEDVDPTIEKLIKGKRYRTISAEVYDDPPEGLSGQGKMLRRVAFLGGEIPQIKSLKDIPMPMSERGGKWERVAIRFRELVKCDKFGCYVTFSEVNQPVIDFLDYDIFAEGGSIRGQPCKRGQSAKSTGCKPAEKKTNPNKGGLREGKIAPGLHVTTPPVKLPGTKAAPKPKKPTAPTGGDHAGLPAGAEEAQANPKGLPPADDLKPETKPEEAPTVPTGTAPGKSRDTGQEAADAKARLRNVPITEQGGASSLSNTFGKLGADFQGLAQRIDAPHDIALQPKQLENVKATYAALRKRYPKPHLFLKVLGAIHEQDAAEVAKGNRRNRDGASYAARSVAFRHMLQWANDDYDKNKDTGKAPEHDGAAAASKIAQDKKELIAQRSPAYVAKLKAPLAEREKDLLGDNGGAKFKGNIGLALLKHDSPTMPMNADEMNRVKDLLQNGAPTIDDKKFLAGAVQNALSNFRKYGLKAYPRRVVEKTLESLSQLGKGTLDPDEFFRLLHTQQRKAEPHSEKLHSAAPSLDDTAMHFAEANSNDLFSPEEISGHCEATHLIGKQPRLELDPLGGNFSDYLDHEVFCQATGKPGVCKGTKRGQKSAGAAPGVSSSGKSSVGASGKRTMLNPLQQQTMAKRAASAAKAKSLGISQSPGFDSGIGAKPAAKPRGGKTGELAMHPAVKALGGIKKISPLQKHVIKDELEHRPGSAHANARIAAAKKENKAAGGGAPQHTVKRHLVAPGTPGSSKSYVRGRNATTKGHAPDEIKGGHGKLGFSPDEKHQGGREIAQLKHAPKARSGLGLPIRSKKVSLHSEYSDPEFTRI